MQQLAKECISAKKELFEAVKFWLYGIISRFD